jgi:O-acetyl-ADP-ribose deacetylase (regulator of RNase III)
MTCTLSVNAGVLWKAMGCSFSTTSYPHPSSSSSSSPTDFCHAIQVVPWGVLGEAMGAKPWEGRPVAPKPNSSTLIVDPASEMMMIDGGCQPGDAGGASGAIYRFLGIDSNSEFPPDVVSALRHGDGAVYKRYGYPDALHVIHAVGPDLRKRSGVAHDARVRAEIVAALAHVYAAVLRLAASQPRELLRLVPISSGIYAGDWAEQMPLITAQALTAGFNLVSGEDEPPTDNADGRVSQKDELPPFRQRRVELCLFDPSEAEAYRQALDEVLLLGRADDPT